MDKPKTGLSSTHRRARGLTLVELMIVIAIIALLVAITIPTVGIAQRRGLEGQATEHLRQIFHAISLYQAANNDQYPHLNLDPLVDSDLLEASFLLLPRDPHPTGTGTEMQTANRPEFRPRYPTSYENIFRPEEGKVASTFRILRHIDPNPGMVVLRIYGNKKPRTDHWIGLDIDCFTGRYLRLRVDGSVVLKHYTIQEWVTKTGVMQRGWSYLRLYSEEWPLNLPPGDDPFWQAGGE